MASDARQASGWRSSPWRKAMWGAAALLLLTPLVAMQFTSEVKWGVFDFIVMGTLLAAACGAFELAARTAGGFAYRTGAGVAIVTAFLLVWINGAVGMIGSEDNPANLMYGAVLAIALVGAALAGFRPAGTARAMAGAALAQLAVGAIAVTVDVGPLNPPGPVGLLALNGAFAGLWLLSAGLFRVAGRSQTVRAEG